MAALGFSSSDMTWLLLAAFGHCAPPPAEIATCTPEAVVYVERVRNLITDGALQPAAPGTSAGGQTVLGFTGFQNEPNLFVGVGAELGLRYQPADGIDVSVNYSFEKLSDCSSTCTTDHAVANQSSPPSPTPPSTSSTWSRAGARARTSTWASTRTTSLA